MAVAFLSIFFFVFLLGFLTSGTVLFLHLFARRKLGIQARTIIAAVVGPGVVMVFPLLIVLFEEAGAAGDMAIGLGLGGLVVCMAIGWPVSAILTRKLEKSMLPDASTFS